MKRQRDTDFLSMTSYIRSQEKYLLGHATLDRVADVASVEEALRMLSQNSNYDFGSLRHPAESETVIKAELQRVYQLAYGLAHSIPQLPEVLGCRYDYHNIKVAIKAHHLGDQTAPPYVRATPVDPAAIAQIVEKYDRNANLPPHIIDAVAAGVEAFGENENPQELDLLLDQQMYARMLELANEVGSRFILGYVKNAIDFYNLKTLLRVKSMQKGTAFLSTCMAEGGYTDPSFFLQHYSKTAGALAQAFEYKNFGAELKAGIDAYEQKGNYSELECLLDNFLIDYVKDAKRISFGPEILFAYLVSKENEIRQIRIVVACKQNQVPNDILKERLRDNYA